MFPHVQSHVSVCAHCSSQPPGTSPPKAAQDTTVPFLPQGLVAGSCSPWCPPAQACPADTPSRQAAFLVHGVVPPHVQHFPHLSLWNCMRLLPAHCSSLSGTPWVAPRPSGVPATPPSLVLSANLLRVQTVPRPLMSMLKRTGPSTDPRRTMMVSGLQLDFMTLISTLFNPPHCVLNQPRLLYFL